MGQQWLRSGFCYRLWPWRWSASGLWSGPWLYRSAGCALRIDQRSHRALQSGYARWRATREPAFEQRLLPWQDLGLGSRRNLGLERLPRGFRSGRLRATLIAQRTESYDGAGDRSVVV